MSATSEAFYNTLANDATLIALLDTYEGSPAIFTTDPIPGGHMRSFVVMNGSVTDRPSDTKTTRGRELLRDIRCYADADGSTVLVEDIAERVRQLFHRTPIAMDGHTVVIAECFGPTTAPTDESLYGRVVQVQLTTKEVS